MGSGNPPDKPGSRVVKLSGDPVEVNAALDILREEGFTVEDNQPPILMQFNYLLVSNYKKENS